MICFFFLFSSAPYRYYMSVSRPHQKNTHLSQKINTYAIFTNDATFANKRRYSYYFD